MNDINIPKLPFIGFVEARKLGGQSGGEFVVRQAHQPSEI
jgi:hypothetical protein